MRVLLLSGLEQARLDAATRELAEYFAGRRRSFELDLDWRLSAGFRATVLQHLPDIAYEQELEVDELFPVAEAMQLLRLADVEGGDIKLTHMGKRFADGEMNERKEIFSRALMDRVPLAAHIRKILDERASHSAPKTRFLDELEDHMAEDSAEETLKTVVSWARFSELFSYDDDAALFSLENPT